MQTCIWPSGCYCHSLSLSFSKIEIGFTFLVPAHLGSPGKRAIKRACVNGCVCPKKQKPTARGKAVLKAGLNETSPAFSLFLLIFLARSIRHTLVQNRRRATVTDEKSTTTVLTSISVSQAILSTSCSGSSKSVTEKLCSCWSVPG